MYFYHGKSYEYWILLMCPLMRVEVMFDITFDDFKYLRLTDFKIN